MAKNLSEEIVCFTINNYHHFSEAVGDSTNEADLEVFNVLKVITDVN